MFDNFIQLQLNTLLYLLRCNNREEILHMSECDVSFEMLESQLRHFLLTVVCLYILNVKLLQ